MAGCSLGLCSGSNRERSIDDGSAAPVARRRELTGERIARHHGHSAAGFAEDEYNLAVVSPGDEAVVADYLFRIDRQ
jgi:hypothetical protein